MVKKGEYDNVKTVSDSAVRIIGLLALIIIIYIDAKTPDYDAKDIEFILAAFVAGSEALKVYKKVKK